jgi:tetratricopeptide (TPR) repeat protein
VRQGNLRLSVAVCAALLGACTPYGARPQSPVHGGRDWVEVSSPRFRVLSDLSVEDAQRVALQLEQGVAAIERVAFEHSRAALQRTTVVVFSRASDFHAFMPEQVEGRFYRRLPGDLESERAVVLDGALSSEARIACLHELTHDLFERNFGPAPPWLNEGWAEYYSTIQIERDRVRVGVALPNLTFSEEPLPFVGRSELGTPVFAMPIDRVPAPSQLLSMDRREFYRASLATHPTPEDRLYAAGVYLGAWELVHMLHDGPEPYPSRYAQFLKNVQTDQVRPAWQKAFAGLSDADFDRDFKTYLTQRQIAMFEYRAHPADSVPALKARALSDAEVHVLWARLSARGAKDGLAARRDLDEAVTEASSSAEARYFRGVYWLNQNQLAAAETDLVAAAQLTPTDPRYLLGVLLLRIKQSPEHAPLRTGDPVMLAAAPLTKLASSPLQLRALALVYRGLRQLDIALEYARRAVQLDPIGSPELEAEAQILNDLGRVEEAVAAQRSAVAFLPESEDGAEPLRRLHEYELRARAAQP